MAEEPKSSLRTALDSIMGWPGQTQGGVQGGTIGVVPRTTDVVNLGTTSAISNVVPEAAPDPFAAQLAEIRAQNDALSASLAAPAAAPVATAAAPITTSYSNIYTRPAPSNATQYANIGGTRYFGPVPSGAYKGAAMDIENEAKTAAMNTQWDAKTAQKKAENDAKLAAYRA